MIILTAIVQKGFEREIRNDRIHYTTWRTIRGKPIYYITNLDYIPNKDIIHTVVPYPKLCWDYVDKLHYSFRLSKELDTDVLWVDFNKVYKFVDIINNIKSTDDLRYYDVWKDYENTNLDMDPSVLMTFKTWEPMKKFCEVNDVDINKLTVPMEEILYIPKGMVTDEMIIDLEKGAGLMSYISFLEKYRYKTWDDEVNLSNGEGFLLSVIMEKYGLNHSKFDIEYFKRSVGWVKKYR